MKRMGLGILVLFLLAACGTVPPTPPVTLTPVPTLTPALTFTPAPTPAQTFTATPAPQPLIPNFDHIVIIVFENKEFGTVIGNSNMPNFNKLANDYTLLTQFY